MRRANGTGSIFKIKNRKLRKPYIVRGPAFISSNGKFTRKNIGSARTLKEAEDILRYFHLKNYNLDKYNLTLEDMLELWKISKHAKSFKTEKTFIDYVNSFEKIFESILQENFIYLKYKDYQLLLDDYAISTSKRAIIVLKSIYSEAIKNEYVTENIANLLSRSQISVRKIRRFIYPNIFIRDLWEKYNKTKNKYIGIILILFYTGMRSIDLIRIKNNNVFLKEKYLITGSKTTAGENRIIPIHNKIIPIIKENLNKGEYLYKNLKYSTLQKRLIEFSKDEISEANLHSIRHTFITKMQKLNVNVSKIKNIVGHSENNITDGVYTHWDINDLLEVINMLEY
ncbi:tyrosine-type recombinase/integrase [Streptobacillus moniliformis]|uniref:tyrosine-type recombinase/integrase n=1 Tax=Streptobacillus moniliformis TaxID=34105 RepID=UPI0007E48FF0|nr:site-specific integrase [Streptobacillus moniliformis]